MKPSSCRIFAIACIVREAGISTVLWLAVLAFRMRVSISATGSVIDISWPPSPRRLRHTRDDSQVGVFAETNAAHCEFTQVASRPPADSAPIVLAHAELRRPLRFNN